MDQGEFVTDDRPVIELAPSAAHPSHSLQSAGVAVVR